MGAEAKRKPSSAGANKVAPASARSSPGRPAAPASKGAAKKATAAPGISIPAKPEAARTAATRKTARALPVRSSPIGETQSLRASLEKLRTESRRRKPAPRDTAPTSAPFVRKPVLQELEARLLLSADLNPAAQDSLLATPAMQGAEFRALAEPSVPTVVTSMQVAPIQRTNELVFVDTAVPEYQKLVEDMRAAALADGRNLEFVLLEQGKDGIRKITDTLAQKSDLDAIHILSHGDAGNLQLGAAVLDFDALREARGGDQEMGRRPHRERRHPDLRLRPRGHAGRQVARSTRSRG